MGILAAVLNHRSGKDTHHHGHTEIQAAPNPCISQITSEITDYHPIHHVSETTLEGIITHEVHRNPIYDKQRSRYTNLPFHAEIQHDYCSYNITYCNSLKRISINPDVARIKRQKITLNNHAEQEQQHKPASYPFIQWLAVDSVIVLCK